MPVFFAGRVLYIFHDKTIVHFYVTKRKIFLVPPNLISAKGRFVVCRLLWQCMFGTARLRCMRPPVRNRLESCHATPDRRLWHAPPRCTTLAKARLPLGNLRFECRNLFDGTLGLRQLLAQILDMALAPVAIVFVWHYEFPPDALPLVLVYQHPITPTTTHVVIN